MLQVTNKQPIKLKVQQKFISLQMNQFYIAKLHKMKNKKTFKVVLRSVLEHFAHLNMLQLASHDSP
jgi:hypothetical protein